MTLEKLNFKPALTVASDYLVYALETMLKNAKGFLEIRRKKEEPIYKIEKGAITAMAFAGIDKDIARFLVERVERKDIIENIAHITKTKPPITEAASFYNNNQPIDKLLTFYNLKEPILLNEDFFKDLANYINPFNLSKETEGLGDVDKALGKALGL